MINMQLNRKFDVITCLFTAIGYVKTLKNYKKTIENFANHLKPGGVILVEPWNNRENYSAGISWLNTYADQDIKIARVGKCKLEKDISILELQYLIFEKYGNI